jgi:hypothetical protein
VHTHATHHRRIRSHLRNTTFDIDEFFEAQIRAEPRLRNNIIRRTRRHPIGQYGTISMGNVAKRSRMDESGCILNRLEQVRFDGIPNQESHGASRFKGLCCDRMTVRCFRHDDPADPIAHVSI